MSPIRPNSPAPPATRLAWLLVVLLVGCGSEEEPLVPLRGRLLYNGKPTPGAEIVFHPLFEGPRWMPVATAVDDGSFETGTRRPGDGAPAGRYRVTATWHPKATDEDPGPNLLPERYSDAKTSPLEVEAKPGSNHFHPLQLTD